MRTFKPTELDIQDCGGVIGYPRPGRYILMVRDERILGGEIERTGEFRRQFAALPRYYPEDAERIVADLSADGTFTQSTAPME